MLKGMLSLLATALLTLSLAAPLVADEIKGKITKVGKKGEKITVKTKGDKEVTVKIAAVAPQSTALRAVPSSRKVRASR